MNRITPILFKLWISDNERFGLVYNVGDSRSTVYTSMDDGHRSYDFYV